MAGEPFSWPEGHVYIWTGAASQSAVAWAQDTYGTFVRGWKSTLNLTGTYHHTQTGRRADVQVGALMVVDHLTLQKWFDSTAEVHMHFSHSAVGASAGLLLYSGRIDNLDYQGREREMFRFNLSYHAHEWSAY